MCPPAESMTDRPCCHSGGTRDKVNKYEHRSQEEVGMVAARSRLGKKRMAWTRDFDVVLKL
jgi:hypothetical protein